VNFIRDRELALRFKNNAVPSRERFLYLLICITLISVIMSSFFISNVYLGTPSNWWDLCTDVLNIVITIIGIVICYRTNRSGDDKEFIERYISIGFPISVQIIAIMLFVSIPAVVIELATEIKILGKGSVFDLALCTILALYFYWRLNLSIKVAASS
jgi:hypothetical protein